MAEDPSAPRDDEPGAPIPADAVDPELLRLPMPRHRRHPMVAIAILILGTILLARLRTDVAYSLQPSRPADLGDARGATHLVPGQYVTLSGTPDYRNAMAFDAKGERSRSFLFRLLGTQSRVLVVTSNASAPTSYEHRFSGRLRRYDDLSYAAAIRDYYQRETRVLRALDLERLKGLGEKALQGPVSLPDRAGQVLSVQPSQELLIDVLFPDDLRVLLSKDKFPSEPDARHEVERLGLPAGPGVETKEAYGYVLRLPPPGPARNSAITRVDGQVMALWHRVETYRVPASAVRIAAAGLLLPGPDGMAQPTRYKPAPGDPTRLVPDAPPANDPTLLPWEQVQALQISEPLLVPADAVALLDGETPAELRWTLPIAALLLLFIGFNLWYLWRGFTEERQRNEPSPGPGPGL